MTPDRSHSDTVVRVAKKVRVEGPPSTLNSMFQNFYVPKYHPSDALPAPENFFSALKDSTWLLFNIFNVLRQNIAHIRWQMISRESSKNFYKDNFLLHSQNLCCASPSCCLLFATFYSLGFLANFATARHFCWALILLLFLSGETIRRRPMISNFF